MNFVNKAEITKAIAIPNIPEFLIRNKDKAIKMKSPIALTLISISKRSNARKIGLKPIPKPVRQKYIANKLIILRDDS